jgi:hypothetical protein
MITVQAVIDSDLAQAISMIRQLSLNVSFETLFPEATQMTEYAANSIARQWKSYASGEMLPNGQQIKQPDSGYVASIKVQKNSAFDYTIYSDSEKADFYENGMASYDMKETHPYGKKSRVAKKRIPKRFGGGFRYVPYLVIPFRWATPKSGAHMGARNVMPQQLYSRILSGMKKGSFKRTKVLDGTKMEPNYFGEMIERAMYASEDGIGDWGSKVGGGMLEGIEGIGRSSFDGTPMLSGLSAMNDKGQTNYMTFRVISADSPAGTWIHPGVKGRHVAQQTADKMREEVNTMIANGFMAGIKRSGIE